jgi:hypothetical protein
VTVLVVDRLRWRRERRVAETSDCHRYRVRFALCFPEYGGAAIRAEVKAHRKAAVRAPPVGPAIAFRLNGFAREERRNAVSTASSLLAFQTMTQRYHHRVARAHDPQLSAGAACSPISHTASLPPLFDPSPQQHLHCSCWSALMEAKTPPARVPRP